MSRAGKAFSISAVTFIRHKGTSETPVAHTEEATREKKPSSEVSKIHKEAHYMASRDLDFAGVDSTG